MADSIYHPDQLNSYLQTYYGHLYPSKLICKWLSYGNVPKNYMERREIALIFENDKHLRYQTFKLPIELQSDLVKKCPHKIDIGAVYNAPAKMNKSVPDFRAVERELVFDIDLTDYDDIRSCCSAATVCDKCWKFIVIAARVLNVVLNKHFGFKHLLWIFSGRRGMHCWVGDKAARKLENNDRSAIAAYLTFRLKDPSFDEWFTHPFAEDAFRAILDSPEIDEVVVEQNWLDDQSVETLIDKYSTHEKTKKNLLSAVRGYTSHDVRWQTLKTVCDKVYNQRSRDEGNKIPDVTVYSAMFLRSLLLDRLNPRLDSNVTTATNHLLKSPFCIHPKTGAVAVPFSLEDAANFRIEDVPKVNKLVAELNDFQNRMEVDEPSENRKPLAYKHTSLKPSIEVFEKFINDLLADQNT